MHQSGKCRHTLFALITLSNCILTYSASGQSRMAAKEGRDGSDATSSYSGLIPSEYANEEPSSTSTYPDPHLPSFHSTLPTTNKSIFRSSETSIEEGASNSNLFSNQTLESRYGDGASAAALVAGSTVAAPTAKQIPKQGTGESAMLNYIYDSYAPNKHKHYDFRSSLRGSQNRGVSNVSVQLNGTAYLNCKVSSLQDRTVSWVKRMADSDKLQLLTVGNHTYSADQRYSVAFQYPNNWRLKVASAIAKDEGTYECQISTYPPRLFRIYLTVNAPEVIIVNEFSEPLFDTFYEADSTIQLNCVVRYMTMLFSVVHWTHNGRLLNDDIVRGGISVKTNLSEEGANSTLFVARVNKSDSGNYTCSIGGPTMSFTTNVHVLNAESLAELYHGGATGALRKLSTASSETFILFLLLFVANRISAMHSAVR